MFPEIWCTTDRFFLSFWAIFCLFTPLTRKIKILKKWKKRLEISSFYTSVPKIMIICCTVSEIWCMTDVIFIFHSGLFFCPFTPLTAQKIKIFKKMKKNTWRYHQFIHVYQKLWSDVARFLRYGVWQMDGWMNRWMGGRKKWYRGGWPI